MMVRIFEQRFKEFGFTLDASQVMHPGLTNKKVKKKECKENQEGSTVLPSFACFAVALAFKKGFRALRVCTFGGPRSFVVSCRWVWVGCSAPRFSPGFVRSFVLAGGACTLHLRH